MEPIKLKSLVQLKSGGPIMRVESFARKQKRGNTLLAVRVADKSQLNCEWFEGSKWKYGTFGSTVLILVSEPDLTNPLSTEAYTELSRLSLFPNPAAKCRN